jgi:hypothetical protein
MPREGYSGLRSDYREALLVLLVVVGHGARHRVRQRSQPAARAVRRPAA